MKNDRRIYVPFDGFISWTVCDKFAEQKNKLDNKMDLHDKVLNCMRSFQFLLSLMKTKGRKKGSILPQDTGKK